MRPTPFTIAIRARVTGTVDAHGNPTITYGAAVPVAVYAIAPNWSQEPDTGRTEVTTGLTVYTPPDAPLPGPLDLVEVDGETWQVDGDPADWTRGPYGSRQGKSFALKRVEG